MWVSRSEVDQIRATQMMPNMIIAFPQNHDTGAYPYALCKARHSLMSHSTTLASSAHSYCAPEGCHQCVHINVTVNSGNRSKQLPNLTKSWCCACHRGTFCDQNAPQRHMVPPLNAAPALAVCSGALRSGSRCRGKIPGSPPASTDENLHRAAPHNFELAATILRVGVRVWVILSDSTAMTASSSVNNCVELRA